MPDRTAILANGLELALVFVGLIVLWRKVLSPEARAQRNVNPSALATWEAPLSDFLLFLWAIICGGILAQFLAAMLFKPLALSEDGRLIFANAGLELGMLGGIGIYRLGLRRGEPVRALAPARALRTGFMTFLIAMPVVVLVGLLWQFLLKSFGLPLEPQDIMSRLSKRSRPPCLSA